MARIRWIRKRDSRQAPFDPTKIADAIFSAAQAVGGEDRALAGELAEAVTIYLEEHYEGDVPGIEDIQDMVEKVLIETGHARTAKAYILYRDQRARIRETLRVRREIESGEYGVSRDLQVSPGGEGRVEGWSKGKIAAALVREAGLEASLAAEVARAVEKKVFAADVRSISTHLIRELADNELFERGLDVSLRRQAQVGIPKYDLEGILLGGKDVSSLSSRIGNRILRDFVLEEVYSRDVARAHREGAIHVHGLDAPLSILEAHLRLPEESAKGELSPRERLREILGGIDGSVARAIHVGDYGTSRLGPEIFARPSIHSSLRGEWLHLPDGGLHLHVPIRRLSRGGDDHLREVLLRPYAQGVEAEIVMEVGEDDTGLGDALAMAADLVAQGKRLSIHWNPVPLAGMLLEQEIALNLPRAARMAGAGNLTSFLEAAHSLISLAHKGFGEAMGFRNRLLGGSGGAISGFPRVHRLSVVGLADGIRGITGGDPALGGKAWEAHLEALQSIRSAVEDLAEMGGPLVRLGATTPQPAAVRFARIDLSTRQGYSRPSPSPAYANGFHLGLEVPIPLQERISREKEIARMAGFGTFVVPRFTEGPPSPEEILDLLLQTRGYPGVVTVARVFHPIPED